MSKIIHQSGKRKTAVARATLQEGSGLIKINNIALDVFQPKLYRLKIREPLLLAGDIAQKVDIDVNVEGGGVMAQAEAARLAIGRALTDFAPKLKKVFLDYDRQLLVADVRFKETHKPNKHGSARSKKQKSYR
ncbi:30S ribosomal protein S9 [Candidatus Woesearchaeota archaeon]|nr:30S ribosomal protein S9 [Candidatus Woesearchaeota archaeon]